MADGNDAAVDETAATEVVKRWVTGELRKSERVTQGQIALTFDCNIDGRHFIVQFNEPNMATSYRKEQHFADRFREAGIPVREVVGIGEYLGLIYTVAKRVTGTAISDLEPDRYREALPSVFSVLQALDSIDIGETTGFGWYDENGIGPYDTWSGHLMQIRDEEPGMYYGRWHELFDTTFLERDRFDRYFRKMIDLVDGIDIPRKLVHGGFGYANLLIDKRAVSVLLDWQDSLFGDHLADIAYMDYWPSGFDLLRLYEAYCRERGVYHDSYYRRIAVCKLYNGLDSMRYFARVGNKDAYDQTVAIIEEIDLSS